MTEHAVALRFDIVAAAKDRAFGFGLRGFTHFSVVDHVVEDFILDDAAELAHKATLASLYRIGYLAGRFQFYNLIRR